MQSRCTQTANSFQVFRNAHAIQIPVEFFEARKVPAATIPPQGHEDARQRRQKLKQAMPDAQYAAASTLWG
jgi:hypothetical protein